MVKTDSAFLKEEKHLEMDKKIILGEMNDKNKEVQDLNHEIDTNPGGTAENIQVIKRLRAKRDKLNSDIKKANEYVDRLLDNYKDKKYNWFNKINYINIDSFRYLIYYKLTKAEEKNLKISVNVSPEIKKITDLFYKETIHDFCEL